MLRATACIATLLVSAAGLVPVCAQVQQPAVATLDVTQVAEIKASDGSHGHIETQAQYELEASPSISGANAGQVKDFQFFEATLRYVSGRLVSGEGTGQGQPYKLKEVDGRVSDYYSMLSGPTPEGNVTLNLRVGPSYTMPDDKDQAGNADLGLACFDGFPNVELSYDQLRNLGTMNHSFKVRPYPSELGNACAGTMATITVQATPIEVKYDKADFDVASVRYVCGRALNDNVYLMRSHGETWLIHANFAGQVYFKGQPKVQINSTVPGCNGNGPDAVTSEYQIMRKSRTWQIDESGNILYKTKDNTPIAHDWQPDNSRGVLDWVDNASLPPPTLNQAPIPPDKWPHRGIQDEFLVGVQGNPSCGCVYISYRLEIKPKAYRIKYSEPEPIDADGWKNHWKSGAPVDLSFHGDEGWVNLALNNNTKQWEIPKR